MNEKPSVEAQLAQYAALVERWAPDDNSEFPITISQERRDGVLVWWVCIHIKVPQRDDFTIESEHKDLNIALWNALYRMQRFTKAASEAAVADYGFGIKYPLRTLK